MSRWEYTETELWRYGEEGVAMLHVFGTIAIKNVVLTFAEAREGDAGDANCPHSIWMRRSTDGGKTFEPNACLIPSQGKRSLTNPVAVYDGEINRLFLFYSENPDNLNTKNYIIFSDDFGCTWSQERPINHFLETDSHPMPLHLAGPGHGIQIKKGKFAGRLLMPFWHRRYGVETPAAQREYCVSLLFSDDHGETWKHTEYMGYECSANESRIVETRDGLLWVLRTGPGNLCRYASISKDGGTSWSKPSKMAIGAAKNCDAGVTQIWGKAGYDNMILVSRVSDRDKRRDMEILISYDGGVTFPSNMTLPAGDAMPGYSDLCTIEEDEPIAGLLHCRNNHVLFSRISLQTLTAGKYENTTRTVWLK